GRPVWRPCPGRLWKTGGNPMQIYVRSLCVKLGALLMFCVLTLLAAPHAQAQGGPLVAWGIHDGSSSDFGQVSGAPTTGTYIAVAAGLYHSVALRSDGSLVAWGWDGFGQVSQTPATGTFKAVAAGFDHDLAIRSDGSLVAWGDDTYGQVSQTPTTGTFKAV